MPQHRSRVQTGRAAGVGAVEIGTRVPLTITGVAHGGVFVGRHEGRVVFVPDTLPGETVVATITEDRGSFLRAVVSEVIESSPERRQHIWPQAALGVPPEQRPGGADFGHIRLDAQRALKRRVLVEALERIGRIEPPAPLVVEPVGSGAVREDGVGWRTRVGLHVDPDGVTGPMAARSRAVVPVTDLPLAHPELVALGEHSRRHPGARRVDLVLADEGPVVLVDGAPERVVTRSAAGMEFLVQASGFWQVHVDAAETLAGVVVDLATQADEWDPEAGNLDLYGGVGLFAGAIAAAGGRITTVEADTQAAELAVRNLAGFPDAAAVPGDALWHLRHARRDRRDLVAATVVLDPPRSGAGGAVVDEILGLAPAQIVYVACDPVSFARDAGALVRGGYRLTELRAFDLYPNSHHVETAALLRRQPS